MKLLKRLKTMMTKKKKKDTSKPKFWRMQFYSQGVHTPNGQFSEYLNENMYLPKLTKKESEYLIDMINKGRNEDAKELTFKGKYCNTIIRYDSFNMVKSYEI